jgi:hypothetical protein
MLKSSAGKNAAVLARTGGIVLVLLVVTACASLFSGGQDPLETPAEPIPSFGYCGAELRELCILSFGRDANGNAIVNFFVPQRDFPDFYLRIRRLHGESVYVCVKNEETPTSVLCMGDVLHLNERVEIDVMAVEDFRLLARGTFTLKAILISPQGWGSPTPATQTPAPAAGTGTPSPQHTGTPPTATSTSTPSVSYPSYP